MLGPSGSGKTTLLRLLTGHADRLAGTRRASSATSSAEVGDPAGGLRPPARRSGRTVPGHGAADRAARVTPPRSARRPWFSRAEHARADGLLERLGLTELATTPARRALRRPAAADLHRSGADARRPACSCSTNPPLESTFRSAPTCSAWSASSTASRASPPWSPPTTSTGSLPTCPASCASTRPSSATAPPSRCSPQRSSKPPTAPACTSCATATGCSWPTRSRCSSGERWA